MRTKTLFILMAVSVLTLSAVASYAGDADIGEQEAIIMAMERASELGFPIETMDIRAYRHDAPVRANSRRPDPLPEPAGVHGKSYWVVNFTAIPREPDKIKESDDIDI